MTVLSSKQGRFYDVPEDILRKHEVPAKRVKEIIAEFEAESGPADGGRPPVVVIHVSGSGAYAEPTDETEGDVEPYGYSDGRDGWGGWGPGPYRPAPILYPRRRRRFW